MSERPFASFCFSTFKRREYLKQTLRSILLQTCPDFEVIVSDNDELESGREAVESFNDPRFKYFPNGENLGMKKSFNRSLERSRGTFIVMIADDDPVYPDMLSTLKGLAEKHPGYGMYMGGCDWFCTSASVGKLYGFDVGTNSCLSNQHDIDFEKVYTPDAFLLDLFSFGIFPHYLWSTALVRRELLLKAGGVPEYGTPFLGDYAYMATVGADSGCVIVNRALGCQTLHGENFGRKQNEQIPIAAANFPAYVETKAAHLSSWPEIRERMRRFTALWVVSHMCFLDHYYRRIKEGDREGFRKAEKEVFRLPVMKGFKMKYWLKKNWPALHDLLVSIKKKIAG